MRFYALARVALPLLLLGGAAGVQAADEAAPVTLTGAMSVEPARRMRAAGFQWDHEIRIALPASYAHGQKSYPVLWVTDGSELFDIAVLVAGGPYGMRSLPEMIVVAVGLTRDAPKDLVMRRTYDFSPVDVWKYSGFGAGLVREQTDMANVRWKAAGITLPEKFGGAAGFLGFMVDTLRPALARDYRMSSEHILFGHSMGGLFCTYALFNRPSAFNGYICGSPALALGDWEAFRMEERYAQTHRDLAAKVFFGAGEGEVLEGGGISAGGIVSSMTRMAEILQVRAYPSLELHVRIFPGEGHGSVVVSNLSWGLRSLNFSSRPRS